MVLMRSFVIKVGQIAFTLALTKFFGFTSFAMGEDPTSGRGYFSNILDIIQNGTKSRIASKIYKSYLSKLVYIDNRDIDSAIANPSNLSLTPPFVQQNKVPSSIAQFGVISPGAFKKADAPSSSVNEEISSHDIVLTSRQEELLAPIPEDKCIDEKMNVSLPEGKHSGTAMKMPLFNEEGGNANGAIDDEKISNPGGNCQSPSMPGLSEFLDLDDGIECSDFDAAEPVGADDSVSQIGRLAPLSDQADMPLPSPPSQLQQQVLTQLPARSPGIISGFEPEAPAPVDPQPDPGPIQDGLTDLLLNSDAEDAAALRRRYITVHGHDISWWE